MMRPLLLPPYIRCHLKPNSWFLAQMGVIRHRILALRKGLPEVSIVIPAFNEEEHILKTISSLSFMTSRYAIEIIVVDNNSTDNTAELVKQTGVRYVVEKQQGVKYARDRGLRLAQGEYILNADADSIYAPGWVDDMVTGLKGPKVSCVYGRFVFIPEGKYPRVSYFLYEIFADLYKRLKGALQDEAMFVYGFNSGFRRNEGLAVGGFEHPEGSNEDGYLALKLREGGFGRLKLIKAKAALVFTSSRRIDELGGPISALNRHFLKKIIFRGAKG